MGWRGGRGGEGRRWVHLSNFFVGLFLKKKDEGREEQMRPKRRHS